VILEWQWFANRDPEPMLRFLGSRPAEKAGDCSRGLGRKLRLFTFGCCRRVRHLASRRAQEALAVFERLLEEAVSDEELRGAHEAARTARTNKRPAPGGESQATCALSRASSAGPISELDACAVAAAKEAEVAAAVAAEMAAKGATAAYRVAGSAERAYQVSLVHDIFGNPFQPIVISPEWRTTTAVALAQQMYESRDFSAMPILADALQDAGCYNDDILNHCRNPEQVHHRGCWVVDRILGKE
jgi:hypothetical protein